MNQERLMNQEIDNDEITIDLTELFMALWSRLHIILMAGVLGALIAFVGTNLLVTPMYTSETKVYVLTRSDSTAGITYNDLQMGTQLTQDYMQLVTSRPVLEQVIAVLNLDMEPGQLKDMISVETPEGTRILSIRVQSEDPKQAKEIADAVRDSVSIQITEIMDADAVNTVEEGNLPSRRLCERLGMRLEGRFVEFVSFSRDENGTPVYENTLVYAVLKREWEHSAV